MVEVTFWGIYLKHVKLISYKICVLISRVKILENMAEKCFIIIFLIYLTYSNIVVGIIVYAIDLMVANIKKKILLHLSI